MTRIAIGLVVIFFVGTNPLFPQSGLYRSGVFLHHSTGYNYWATGTTNTVPSEIIKYNTAHGYSGGDAVALNRQGFPSAGDNEWYTWHMLFDSPGGYGGDNIFPIIAVNKIVMIKSCFPSSGMSGEGSAADTLTPATKSTYNYKWHWRSIIRVMSDYPDNFFVIWTNSPLARGATSYSTAQRSHRFSKWAKDTLAAGLDPVFGAFPNNVYVFDIFHKVANDSGFIPYPEYAMSNMDSHPNPAAADLVAPIIVQEVFDAAIAYEGGAGVPDAPELASPENGSTDQVNYLFFRWHPTASATSYCLQVSDDSSFGDNVINDSTITDTLRAAGPLDNLTTYYWRVRAKNQAGPGGWSERWEFTTSAESFVYSYHAGWNIVSVPLTVADYSVDQLFPSAVSDAFEYQGNYVPRDTLSNGLGYWLKFNEMQFIPLVGTPFLAETLLVSTGWNLIGTISDSVNTASVISVPSGIINSPFYGFNGSYEAVTVLIPGNGYWVKVGEPGEIIIRCDP